MENPDLWNDPKHAQEISKEKKLLDDIVGSFNRLTAGVNDAADLFELSMAEEDWETLEAVGQDVEAIEREVAQLEFKRMFNQPMDSSNCYLEIQAGAGGTEAQDWASMLERMYMRYAERKGFKVTLEEESAGDVAGIKSATLFIEGECIQKTESAVRIHHVPSGIITICQDDRSQHRNREKAMQQLKAKLYELEMRKRMEEQTKLEESKSDIGWGHQIRSYVLDQSRVKDLRTNVETGNTGAVLDGDLDQFIEASLKLGVGAA